jgi:uncharacterized protein YkwD
MKITKIAFFQGWNLEKSGMMLCFSLVSLSIPLMPSLTHQKYPGHEPLSPLPPVTLEENQTGRSPGQSSHPESLNLAQGDEMAYLSQLEALIIREMNQARANPRDYADQLEALKPYYEGRLFRRPGEIPIRTQEGLSAVNEAIRALRAMDPKPSLRPSRGMSQAARDLVEDQGPRGGTGHIGGDRSTPFERMNRYGRWRGSAAENISYGPDTAEQVVLQLIIDDGVPDRGHRENIFNPGFRWTGVACGPHATYGQICVMVYANDYEERN